MKQTNNLATSGANRGIFFNFNFFLPFILLFICNTLSAQTLDFKDDFNLEENDMDAQIHYPKIDQNGNKMAIIKMVNPNKGFVFDIGSIGDAIVEEKKGETWVYVPKNTKRITVNHESLGVKRNYEIPLEIEAGRVYSVTLISGEVQKVVKETFNKGFLSIETIPNNADVYVDNGFLSSTPIFSQTFKIGTFHLKITKNLYYDFDTSINVKINEHVKINLHLKPKFGFLKINTSPINDASIIIDDDEKYPKTPALIDKLKAGKHTLQLKKEDYKPIKLDFEIKENETTTISQTLMPSVGFLQITATPKDAAIYIDNTFISKDSVYKKLNINTDYLIEVIKENYKTEYKTISLKPNELVKENFSLQRLRSDIVVITIPDGATIYIDNELQNMQTPTQLQNIPVGEHIIECRKKGFKNRTKKIFVKDKEILEFKENLIPFSGAVLNADCNNVSQVNVFANNVFLGATPLNNIEINKGTVQFRFEKLGYQTYTERKYIDSPEISLSINMQQNNPQNNQETKDLYEVKFTSNQDNATLYLNNTWIGKTPLKYSLEKGNYTLLLKKEDCYTLKQSITVDENTNEFNLTLKPFKKLFFTGIKVGLSQSNMGILTNNAGPISPYNTYYIINNINQIFMPAAVVYPYFGINAEYFTSIKRKFSFQLEANITNIGADYLYGNNIKMQQLSIPFTAKWFFMPKRWAFTANTSYNILLNAEFNGQDILPLLQTNYFSLGVGTEIHLSPWFYVGAAYNTQQKPILANDQGNNAHNYPPINIQAFLGYRF